MGGNDDYHEKLAEGIAEAYCSASPESSLIFERILDTQPVEPTVIDTHGVGCPVGYSKISWPVEIEAGADVVLGIEPNIDS